MQSHLLQDNQFISKLPIIFRTSLLCRHFIRFMSLIPIHTASILKINCISLFTVLNYLRLRKQNNNGKFVHRGVWTYFAKWIGSQTAECKACMWINAKIKEFTYYRTSHSLRDETQLRFRKDRNHVKRKLINFTSFAKNCSRSQPKIRSYVKQEQLHQQVYNRAREIFLCSRLFC